MDASKIQNLPDPVPWYNIGDTRDKPRMSGEGKKIRVEALALIVRKGSAESCNCRLLGVNDTSNTIVLVNPSLQRPTLARYEASSVTAKFTPRVRPDHPNFTRRSCGTGSLHRKVPSRCVTGLLPSTQHSLGYRLNRITNWEIHPVLGLSIIPTGKRCTADNDST